MFHLYFLDSGHHFFKKLSELIPIFYLDCIGLGLALIIFSILYKRVTFKGKLYAFLYSLIFFVCTAFASFLSFKDLYNNWIYDLVPLLLSIPLYFFYRSQALTLLSKRINLIAFLAILIVYAITWRRAIDIPFNAEYYLVFALFIMINSVIYLFQELNHMTGIETHKKIEFWFIATLFFYASVCSLLWSAFSYLSSLPVAQTKTIIPGLVWSYCHNTILFIQSLVFSLILIWNRKKL